MFLLQRERRVVCRFYRSERRGEAPIASGRQVRPRSDPQKHPRTARAPGFDCALVGGSAGGRTDGLCTVAWGASACPRERDGDAWWGRPRSGARVAAAAWSRNGRRPSAVAAMVAAIVMAGAARDVRCGELPGSYELPPIRINRSPPSRHCASWAA
jgi:hypothetical protein